MLHDKPVDIADGIKVRTREMIVVILTPTVLILGTSKDTKIIAAYDQVNQSLWSGVFKRGKADFLEIVGKSNYDWPRLIAAYLNEMKIPAERVDEGASPAR